MRRAGCCPVIRSVPPGLLRFAEAANQVRGAAGEHQVEGAKVAIGMAYGANSQYFSTWVVGSSLSPFA
jgi:acetyl-CoA C-acetyltransferase